MIDVNSLKKYITLTELNDPTSFLCDRQFTVIIVGKSIQNQELDDQVLKRH